MMRVIDFAFILSMAMDFLTSTPLDDLTVNVNFNESPKNLGWKDDEFEADNNEPTVVIIGGVSHDREILNDAEIMDEDRTWKPMTPKLTEPRHNMAAVSVKNKIYVIGGKIELNRKAPVKYFSERDEDENKWKHLSELNIARFLHTATAVNTRAYSMIIVTGGHGGFNNAKKPATSTEIYTFGKVDKWEINAAMRFPRCAHAAIAFKGRLYVMGGAIPKTISQNIETWKSVESFDFNERLRWEIHSEMKVDRMSHGAVLSYNTKLKVDTIYVCGGISVTKKKKMEYLATCEYLDENTNKWKYDTPMNQFRANFGLAMTQNEETGEKIIWAIGGYNDKDGVLDSVEWYTPKEGWILAPLETYSLRKPRMYFGITLYVSPQGANARTKKMESAKIVNSTFVS